MILGFRAAFQKLWLIIAVAFCLRFALVLMYEATTSRQALSVIPFLFEPGNIAYSLAHGHGFSSPLRVETGPTAWMTPVYPLLLAAIFKVWGSYTFPAYLAAVLFNIVCSALTCIPIFAAGTRLAGLGVGVAAAWLWAVFPNAILIPVQSMWDASLSALLAATILWATLALTRSSGLRDWCLYGLLWGFTLMTDATLILLLPLLAGWIAWHLRKVHESPWFTRPLLSVGIAFLCCVPWTIRNLIVFHELIPFRSVLGLQLWVGNSERAPDRRPGEIHPLSNSAEREKYRRMGELPYMREKEEEALHFIGSHPAIEIHLVWDRFIATWTGGTPHPIADFFRVRSFEFRLILLFNLAVALGTFAGAIMILRNGNPYAFPVLAFPLFLPIPAYLTLASARYRHPVDPAILLLTAVALHQTLHLWRGRSKISHEFA